MSDQEISNCGLFAIATPGIKSHDNVEKTVTALERMNDRSGMLPSELNDNGEVLYEGDGTGIGIVNINMAHRVRKFRETGFGLDGSQGVDIQDKTCGLGMFFIPRENPEVALDAIIKDIESIRFKKPELAELGGLKVLGYREIQLDLDMLGPRARATHPYMAELVYEKPEGMTDKQFDILVAKANSIVRDRAVERNDGSSLIDMSRHSTTYKTTVVGAHIGRLIPELHDADLEGEVVLGHDRHATNTGPVPSRAQPYTESAIDADEEEAVTVIGAHNGEVNNIGKVWYKFQLRQKALGGDERHYSDGSSDSGKLTGIIAQQTVDAGTLEAALVRTIPPAFLNDPTLTDEQKAALEQERMRFGGADGPIAFVSVSVKTNDDGTVEVTLAGKMDADNTRPLHFRHLKDGTLIFSSNGAVIDVPADMLIEKEPDGQPGHGVMKGGQLTVMRMSTGEVKHTEQIIAEVTAHPALPPVDYMEEIKTPESLSDAYRASRQTYGLPTLKQWRASGMESESLAHMLQMAEEKQIPTQGMGNDAANPGLEGERMPIRLASTEVDEHALITNPSVDPKRDADRMRKDLYIGADPVLYDAGLTPQSPFFHVKSPFLRPGQMQAIVERAGDHIITIDMTFVPPVKTEAFVKEEQGLINRIRETEDLEELEKLDTQLKSMRSEYRAASEAALTERLKEIQAEVRQALLDGRSIVVLDDRNTADGRAMIPAVLATGLVTDTIETLSAESVEEGGRPYSAGVMVNTAQASNGHEIMALVERGAQGVNAYLVWEEIAQQVEAGKLEDKTREEDDPKKKTLLTLEEAFQRVAYIMDESMQKIPAKTGERDFIDYGRVDKMQILDVDFSSNEIMARAMKGIATEGEGLLPEHVAWAYAQFRDEAETLERRLEMENWDKATANDKAAQNGQHTHIHDSKDKRDFPRPYAEQLTKRYRVAGIKGKLDPETRRSMVAKFEADAGLDPNDPHRYEVTEDQINNHDIRPEYREFADFKEKDDAEHPKRPLDCFGIKEEHGRQAISLDEVESAVSIVGKLLSLEAMSNPALTGDANAAIHIGIHAVNAGIPHFDKDGKPHRKIKVSRGEGGEHQEDHFHPEKGSGNSAQFGTGWFDITPTAISSAQFLEIKYGQGAKPGEGGQIPGWKNNVKNNVALIRRATPGTPLISPSNHPGLKSIEDNTAFAAMLGAHPDLEELSLKVTMNNRTPSIVLGLHKSMIYALGLNGPRLSYNFADNMGGTAAAPRESRRYTGTRAEYAMLEAYNLLNEANLADTAEFKLSGGISVAMQAFKALALLHASGGVGLGTTFAQTVGCIKIDQCNVKDACKVGVATEGLFAGDPRDVRDFVMDFVQDFREIMAKHGFRTFEEVLEHGQEIFELRERFKDRKDLQKFLVPTVKNPIDPALRDNLDGIPHLDKDLLPLIGDQLESLFESTMTVQNQRNELIRITGRMSDIAAQDTEGELAWKDIIHEGFNGRTSPEFNDGWDIMGHEKDMGLNPLGDAVSAAQYMQQVIPVDIYDRDALIHYFFTPEEIAANGITHEAIFERMSEYVFTVYQEHFAKRQVRIELPEIDLNDPALSGVEFDPKALELHGTSHHGFGTSIALATAAQFQSASRHWQDPDKATIPDHCIELSGRGPTGQYAYAFASDIMRIKHDLVDSKGNAGSLQDGAFAALAGAEVDVYGPIETGNYGLLAATAGTVRMAGTVGNNWCERMCGAKLVAKSAGDNFGKFMTLGEVHIYGEDGIGANPFRNMTGGIFYIRDAKGNLAEKLPEGLVCYTLDEVAEKYGQTGHEQVILDDLKLMALPREQGGHGDAEAQRLLDNWKDVRGQYRVGSPNLELLKTLDQVQDMEAVLDYNTSTTPGMNAMMLDARRVAEAASGVAH